MQRQHKGKAGQEGRKRFWHHSRSCTDNEQFKRAVRIRMLMLSPVLKGRPGPMLRAGEHICRQQARPAACAARAQQQAAAMGTQQVVGLREIASQYKVGSLLGLLRCMP